MATRQQLYKKSIDLDKIFSASISPDSQTLATGGENSIVLWDLATGARRSETRETGSGSIASRSRPTASCWRRPATTSGGVVTLWDSSTGKVVGTLTGHENAVRAMAFTHDGKTLATGGADRTIRLWDVATRQQIGMLQGPENGRDSGGPPIADPGRRLFARRQQRGHGQRRRPGERLWSCRRPACCGRGSLMPTRPPPSPIRPTDKTLASGGYDKDGQILESGDRRADSFAQRPYGLGRFAGVFARRPDAGQRQLRPLDPAVERGRRRRAPGTGRPHGDGSLAGLFARRQAVGQRRRRPDRAAVGRGQRQPSKPR